MSYKITTTVVLLLALISQITQFNHDITFILLWLGVFLLNNKKDRLN